MRNYFIIFGFTLLMNVSCNPGYDHTDYLDWQRRAMLAFKSDDFDIGLKHFEKCIKIMPSEETSNYLYAAACALELDKDHIANDVLIDGITSYFISKRYFNTFEGFDSLRQHPVVMDIKDKFDSLQQIFYSGLKCPSEYFEIDSLIKRDQEVRTNNRSTMDMWEVDSLNINRLMEITEKCGWIRKGEIILWHQRYDYGKDTRIWNFFTKKIEEHNLKAKRKNSIWARYEDNRAIESHGRQIFGQYYYALDQYPLESITNIDQKRDSIGLHPFWYLNEIYGFPVPDGYDIDFEKQKMGY